MKKILIMYLLSVCLYSESELERDVRLCDIGFTPACTDLGAKYANGDVVKKDTQRAKGLFLKACTDKDQSGCFNLGRMYSEGIGVRQDKLKAKSYYAKTCNSGVGERGCYALGLMYYSGDGVRQNKIKAKEFFGKACDDGHVDGCKAYKYLNEAGIP